MMILVGKSGGRSKRMKNRPVFMYSTLNYAVFFYAGLSGRKTGAAILQPVRGYKAAAPCLE
uniref:hypothetical protein n=1 Tax=Rheinheimera sp. TaxID=1869214 RepID=UPI004047A8E6